jgi:FtsP/CotA-like multicopper oxidase with cupredoxin domain
MNNPEFEDSDNRHKIERRSFLKLRAGVVGGAITMGVTSSHNLVGSAFIHRRHHLNPKPEKTAAPTLSKFVDPLPIPQMISPSGMVNNVPFFDVNMMQFRKKQHRDLPPTTLWGYNGMYPGPIFEARSGSPVAVQWRNSLPTTHFLPNRPYNTRRGTSGSGCSHGVHLHGAKVLPESDGYPERGLPMDSRKNALSLPRESITIQMTNKPLRSGTTITRLESHG